MKRSTKKEIRTWALVMAAILVVVGVVQFFLWGHVKTATVFWTLSALFFLSGIILPTVLRPLYFLWLKFAASLAWVNTRLLIGIIFFLIFSPIGIILRILRKDLIKQSWDAQASSYWIKRPDEPFDSSRYEKQY